MNSDLRGMWRWQVPVIPAMYFGPVDLYRVLARHTHAVVDTGEHYERQSYRTRTSIVGANGVQDLVVQIARRSGEKMPMREVRLSYAETWPAQHMHAIRSAYGKTPWYIHFEDGLKSMLHTGHGSLVELDLTTMHMCLRWAGIRCELQVIEQYIPPEEIMPGLDLRQGHHPKRPIPPALGDTPVYPQVFSDRHGFVPRMSMIDLLCNAGPATAVYLR